MTFADMVLARDLIRKLDDQLVGVILDGIDGEQIVLEDGDREEIASFARALRYEFGDRTGPALEIELMLRRLDDYWKRPG